MKPTKNGQIVRFHTPLPDENPMQLYVLLEAIFDVERPRGKIKALNSDSFLASIHTVFLEDLEITEVETSDLLGYYVNMLKTDQTISSGKVVNVSQPKTLLDLNIVNHLVETNVLLTIIDEKGTEQTGMLIVKTS